MKFSFRESVWVFVLAALPSCHSLEDRRNASGSEALSPREVRELYEGEPELPAGGRPADAGLLSASSADEAVVLGGILVYKVRYLRAEPLAATLQALLEPRYGPLLRVVPHPETNQLLIHVPPRSEWGDRGPRRAVPAR